MIRTFHAYIYYNKSVVVKSTKTCPIKREVSVRYSFVISLISTNRQPFKNYTYFKVRFWVQNRNDTFLAVFKYCGGYTAVVAKHRFRRLHRLRWKSTDWLISHTLLKIPSLRFIFLVKHRLLTI